MGTVAVGVSSTVRSLDGCSSFGSNLLQIGIVGRSRSTSKSVWGQQVLTVRMERELHVDFIGNRCVIVGHCKSFRFREGVWPRKGVGTCICRGTSI